MGVIRVRVPATWQNPDSIRGKPEPHYGVADFTLGVGPCGKTVVALDVEYGQHAVVVIQTCSDTERKVFIYPYHTITGRVEVTYG